MLYAHTKDGAARDEWQGLDDHLQEVARLSEGHADRFRSGEWGRLFGLLHDIGKCNPDLQLRLTGENRRHADHKGTGTRLLDDLDTGFGRIGAYCVAGHHGGLAASASVAPTRGRYYRLTRIQVWSLILFSVQWLL